MIHVQLERGLTIAGGEKHLTTRRRGSAVPELNFIEWEALLDRQAKLSSE